MIMGLRAHSKSAFGAQQPNAKAEIASAVARDVNLKNGLLQKKGRDLIPSPFRLRNQ
jgi:hypothetical protein